MGKITINGITRDMTADEQSAYDAKVADWNSKSAERKLAEIKELRLERLQSTDYMANVDYTMPDYIKTWRQSLRDIPANHTDEDAYDLLLERDSSTKLLKHTIWKQPTE